jgi:hypothetical protein
MPVTTPLLSMAEWARRCGRTGERARQVLDTRKIRGARPLIIGRDHSSWAVPVGTHWPVEVEYHFATPPGMVDIRTWAESHGKTRDCVLRHVWLSGPTKAMKKVRGRWFVPEGTPWPWKLGRPPKRRAP